MRFTYLIRVYSTSLQVIIDIPASVLLMRPHVMSPTERLTMHSSLLKKEDENYSTSCHGDDSSVAAINIALNAP